VIIDLLKKGSRLRTVPVPGWVKLRIEEWLTVGGISSGCVFRAINKGGRLPGDGLGANVVWSVVQGYAAAMACPTWPRRPRFDCYDRPLSRVKVGLGRRGE
jgi:hypothetical protein